MKITDTTATKGHFHNNPRFGRTTKLVEKTTGRVLFEAMGVCTRKELWAAFTA